MYSGDSLTVLLFLLGSAIASMIGAVTATGKRATFLWWLMAAFALLAVGWILAPAANTIVEAIKLFMIALVVSGAPVMVITVAIVALMLGGRQSADNVVAPAEASSAPSVTPVLNRASKLYDVKVAVRSARSAMADNPTDRMADKQLPRIRASMLTLSKEFGVSFPASTRRPNIDLEAYLRIIEEMLPYLLAGHDDAAREVGEKWVRKLDKTA